MVFLATGEGEGKDAGLTNEIFSSKEPVVPATREAA